MSFTTEEDVHSYVVASDGTQARLLRRARLVELCAVTEGSPTYPGTFIEVTNAVG